MKNYKRTLIAGYLGFVTQAIAACFAPLLYLTFRDEYGVTLSQLAMVSACLFITQIVVDYLCAKVVDRIGYRKCILASEILSFLGLAGLAVLPDAMPNHFLGILICVFTYAIGCGLIEVLCNPIIEACPFEHKDRVISMLHSFYCWGMVAVILLSTLYFAVFGIRHWRILACFWSLVPLYNIYNFATCPIEPLIEDGKGLTVADLLRTRFFWILLLLMVCAGASEIAIEQWASAFVESALRVSKTVGDLAGPCGFAILMGISRVFYGKFGDKVDLTGFIIASGALCLFCYLLAALSRSPILGLIGCMLCGFSVGIMWPGSISLSSQALPRGGTAMYALLALAGDTGAAIGPAIVGTVSQAANNDLRVGLLTAIGFPILLVVSVILVRKWRKAHETA